MAQKLSTAKRGCLIVLSLNQLQQLAIFENKDITKISPLTGGLCHRLYKVTYVDQHQCTHHYVLRYLNVSFNESAHEYHLMELAYALGIAPFPSALIDLTDQLQQPSSLIVMDFVEGDLATCGDFDDRNISQLADYLARLHTCDRAHLSIKPSPNTLGLLDEYWQRYNMKTVADIKRFAAIKRHLSSLIFNNTSLIHGDLNLSNIMISRNELTWLDWEFSSIGDAYVDYAALCIESDGKVEQRLIDALNNHSDVESSIDKSRLSLFKLYYAASCWLWTPALTGQSYLNHHHRYERIVDQLLMATVEGKTTLL